MTIPMRYPHPCHGSVPIRGAGGGSPRMVDQPRFDGIVRLHTAREVAAQQGTIQPDYTVARTAAEGSTLDFGSCSPARADHDLRSLLTRSGRRDEADGDRGHLPRRLGHVGQGFGRGSRSRTSRATRSARSPMRRPAWFARSSPPTRTSSSLASQMDEETRRSTRDRLPARSSSPTPTRAMAATRTCGT